MADNTDNAALIELLIGIRNEVRDHRALLLEAIDRGRSFERHMDTQILALNQRIRELGDDLEQTIRSELMGLLG